MTKPATTWDDLAALRRRNAERLEAAKAAMGAKYLLHPDNRAQRHTPKPAVLGSQRARLHNF